MFRAEHQKVDFAYLRLGGQAIGCFPTRFTLQELYLNSTYSVLTAPNMAASAPAPTATGSPASLRGQTVLVFGGSSGMGKAAAVSVVQGGGIAWIVGRDGAKVSVGFCRIFKRMAERRESRQRSSWLRFIAFFMLLFDVEILQLDTAKAEIIAAAGGAGEVRTARVDVTDESSVEAFFAGIPAGGINHLVATVGASASASDITGRDGFARLKAQFDLKFFAQAVTVSYGAAKIADGGSIVLVSGALTKRPGKGSAALAAANAALEVLGRGLANDFGPRLRINTVSPVRSPICRCRCICLRYRVRGTALIFLDVIAARCRSCWRRKFKACTFIPAPQLSPPVSRCYRALWTRRSGPACPPPSRAACSHHLAQKCRAPAQASPATSATPSASCWRTRGRPARCWTSMAAPPSARRAGAERRVEGGRLPQWAAAQRFSGESLILQGAMLLTQR